jgi:hypothetical protein
MDDPEYRKELGHWIGLGALGSSWLIARIGRAVAVHPMSQTLECPELRTRLQGLLDSSAGVPQHLLRMSYTDVDPGNTPRWPLETVLADR